ncbi:MAG TPA: hypothetical protein VFR02_05465, partial [bacterium]|nr:hypothetical protein [bacterium]
VLLQPSDPRADLVRKEFKDATDTLVKSNKEGTPTVLRIMKIPAADIPAGPGKLFGFERVGPGAWIREYFDSAYLLGAGVLDYVEKVDSPYGPVPSAQGGHMLRILGEVSVPAKTTWRLSVTTANYAILKLDGRRVLDLKPNGRVVSRVRTLTLGPGDHAVDYLVYLRVGNEIPEIKIEGPGGSVRRLGDPPPPAAPSAFQLGRP